MFTNQEQLLPSFPLASKQVSTWPSTTTEPLSFVIQSVSTKVFLPKA